MEKSTSNCDSLKLYHEKVWLELQISFSQMGGNSTFLEEIIIMFVLFWLFVLYGPICHGALIHEPIGLFAKFSYAHLLKLCWNDLIATSLTHMPAKHHWSVLFKIKALIALLPERSLVAGIRFLFNTELHATKPNHPTHLDSVYLLNSENMPNWHLCNCLSTCTNNR